MCYVHNQWYDISCATLYISFLTNLSAKFESHQSTCSAVCLYSLLFII